MLTSKSEIEISTEDEIERVAPQSSYTTDGPVMNINNRSNYVHAGISSLINCETLRIHPTSDIFDPTKNYVGLINYLTGDIYIRQSDWILNNIPQRKGRRHGNYLHGRLFYSIYRRWKKQNTTFMGGGFFHLDNEWKFISRTLNTENNDHHLKKFDEIILQLIINNIYINHRWLGMHPDHRIDCKRLDAMERNKKYTCRADSSTIHVDRKLHGTVKWLNNQRRRLGFIECIGLDRDFYIHATTILNNGSYSEKNVEFNIIQGRHGWKAGNITAIWP
ncbi:unnamed protein product [Rotaria magnacalcarata]|uniref:CSD domain-containing protein n=3 Tax=Rotaria magnacalcarata TaxID=392030 RepID=A0A816PP29_9BILA|nr:unnamed protein product [Rotaria magnacalcarata]CAF2085092.1 unnamed protein product [Rotaria magnacalcarata]CAF2266240.1 unnamed protein product [Rotaria magnacalcarata]CAF3828526.1 unnamed protein product [Rotaria magnacalcarata]CAF4050633.1 unnamed protein product [Rotaria magnacalcarata]